VGGQGEGMTVKEVYEKYKHMDPLLSDEESPLLEDFTGQILLDFWQAIKDTVEKEEK
jgi:hypothetical protein